MKTLDDYLSKSSSQLLAEFKWGSAGESEFRKFIDLAKEEFEDRKDVSEDRKYVLLSVKWSRGNDNCVFWGRLTSDDQRRSYSGYTDCLDHCERYTKDEIRDHKLWGGQTFYELVKEDPTGTWAIGVKSLDKMGYKKTVIWR
ncbi:hypothetical protein [Halobacillus litoralis]|uniref:hypothetical protein n=1 Tax=Halobacillus litoralis TaxID=45668 RepID=UPI001CD325FE|nr:hypothetical protein [Halobacillus litoralis]MCA1021480.1 hypothetical protein [Halobacillus litoralis]